MKQARATGLFFLILIAALGFYTWTAAAQSTEAARDDVKITQGTVNDDVITAGRTVRVNAEIDGDLAAAGSDVTVDGEVDGYVMSAGRTVTLDGRIGNDLWAAGQTVQVNAPVGNNAMIAGRTVHLQRGTVVGHDARLAGNTVTSEGKIERNLSIGASTAQIGGEVGGNVNARATRVTVLPGTVIHGDLHVAASQHPDISPSATVLGQVRYEPIEQPMRWLTWPFMWIFCFTALLVLGLAAVAFSPAWAARVATTLRTHVSRSFLIGLALLIVAPLVIGGVAVTLIGIPLAVVMLAAYVLCLALSGVFVSYRVGEWLLDRMHRSGASQWARIALGTLVVSLGMTLPAVGWFIALLVLMAGAGALALEQNTIRHQLR